MITLTIIAGLVLIAFFVYSDYRTAKNRKAEALDSAEDPLVD